MEQYKCLYKDHSTKIIPRQNNKLNREFQEANRSKKRKERFQDFRNISPSPTPKKTEVIVKLCRTESKENASKTNGQENEKVARVAKIVCNTTNPEKLTKQEAYLKRFIEWKENKKLKEQNEKQMANKKKPFLTAVSSSRQNTTSISIVPKGHHDDFRPPLGLKMPEVAEPQKSLIKGRQSIYTIVPTPPRKPKADEKCLNKIPIAKQTLLTNMHTRYTTSSKTANRLNTNQPKTPAEGKNSAPRKSPYKASTAKVAVQNIARTLEKARSVTKTPSELPVSRANLRPRVLKMPPPPPPAKSTKKVKEEKKTNAVGTALTAATTKQAGAAGKIRSIASKRMENIKQTKKSPLKNTTRLAQNLKAKKPLNGAKKLSTVPTLQVNGKKLFNLINNKENEDMIIQTPKDFTTLNPFEEFVTSTKLKTSVHNLEVAEGLKPFENKRSNSNSSVKRNIMQDAANTDNQEVNGLSKKLEMPEKVAKKYNFLIHPENTNTENVVEEPNREENKEQGIEDIKTPPKSGPEERPSNYLSPFVSVARGKVSLKKETEKRNSIYLQNQVENQELISEPLNPPSSPKVSVEIRRVLEAVRYFRQQLQNEIDRLLKLCEVWEKYKNENLEKIQNANGEDMINVAIGQTRLLTSKKFMQFKGLIDRCESGATGIGAVEYDGSEDTKPITTVDLEGFWSMLGLQVDNLDKRFETLNRWKSNDWNDPDEVKSKIKNNLAKVKKTKTGPAAKAKPNAALQQMLRKMHAEMRKNKKSNQENDNSKVIVLTSSKQKQRRSDISNNSTPRRSIDDSLTSRRMSIVVRDRKYFSPAATVISVLSPNHRTSLQRKSSQDSPKILKEIKKFNQALDTMESSVNLRKSLLLNGNALNLQTPKLLVKDNNIGVGGGNEKNSPVPSARKSILKTPGTAKSRMRNVIFNEKLRVKKFNFLINDDGDALNPAEVENNESHEEDLIKSHEDNIESESGPQRTLTLRNRKVRLRPSSEIIIPIK